MIVYVWINFAKPPIRLTYRRLKPIRPTKIPAYPTVLADNAALIRSAENSADHPVLRENNVRMAPANQAVFLTVDPVNVDLTRCVVKVAVYVMRAALQKAIVVLVLRIALALSAVPIPFVVSCAVDAPMVFTAIVESVWKKTVLPIAPAWSVDLTRCVAKAVVPATRVVVLSWASAISVKIVLWIIAMHVLMI